MSPVGWIAGAGAVLLLCALTSGWIRRLPITTFWIFLAAGLLVGPWGLDVWRFELAADAAWLAAASELCLVVSLFAAGLKLRLSLRATGWRAAARLALPAMVLCIGGVALAVHLLFGTPWPLALMCGAVIAPTDPVLASIVSVGNAADHDGLRFALSGEAGLNDGMALPFLVLGLLWLQAGPIPDAAALGHWFTHDLLWSLLAGMAVGGLIGWGLGTAGACTRHVTNETAPSDFLALAIMLLAYAAAEMLDASVFLAAFAAGLGLRYAELRIVSRHPHPDAAEADTAQTAEAPPPAELLVERHQLAHKDSVAPAESIGLVVSDALSFGDTLERLIAVTLVFVAGAAFARYVSVPALVTVLLLFAAIRPLTVYLATVGLDVPRPRRWMMGWLGVRGVGTLNYLIYAIHHGARGSDARWLAEVAITAVVLSVLLHGVSAGPLMAWRERRLQALREARGASG